MISMDDGSNALLAMDAESLKLSLSPSNWTICREWLPQGNPEMTGFKIACAAVAISSLLIVFANQRASREPIKASASEPRLDDKWMNAFESAVLKKADPLVRQIEAPKTTVASPEPATVATERVLPDAPGRVPPVVLVDREEKPAARQNVSTERNICTRHKMQKVWVSKYSWRCRKP